MQINKVLNMKLSNIFKHKSDEEKERKIISRVTAMNLYWRGSFHSDDGFNIYDKEFTVNIPFHNHSNEAELSFLKANEFNEIVNSIKTATPFSIKSIKPDLPITIKPGDEINFKIKLTAPDYNYNGPLTLKFESGENKDLIDMDITGISIINGDRKADIEKDRVFTNFAKNQIFELSIQMYKVCSYKDKINKINVNEPFKLISISHKPPFEIDNPDSYIVKFSIQSPDYNYSGPVEIYVNKE